MRGSPELPIALFLLAVLVGVSGYLRVQDPRPVLGPREGRAHELEQLEDAFAAAPGNSDLARRLTAQYLQRGAPALAVSVVRSALPQLTRDPVLTHRLALAYEALGRVDDAYATARLATVRCREVVLSGPLAGCGPGELARFESHARALDQMLRWGVTDPRVDPRARTAHELSQRWARIARAD